MGEDGKWCACNLCHDLIESDNYAAMTERSVLKMIDKGPHEFDVDEIRGVMMIIHQQFAACRTGEAVKLKKQEES